MIFGDGEIPSNRAPHHFNFLAGHRSQAWGGEKRLPPLLFFRMAGGKGVIKMEVGGGGGKDNDEARQRGRWKE